MSKQEIVPSPYLRSREAAAYIRRSASWVEHSRSYGGGPPYVKSGGQILYLIAALDAWIEAQKVQGSGVPLGEQIAALEQQRVAAAEADDDDLCADLEREIAELRARKDRRALAAKARETRAQEAARQAGLARRLDLKQKAHDALSGLPAYGDALNAAVSALVVAWDKFRIEHAAAFAVTEQALSGSPSRGGILDMIRHALLARLELSGLGRGGGEVQFGGPCIAQAAREGLSSAISEVNMRIDADGNLASLQEAAQRLRRWEKHP